MGTNDLATGDGDRSDADAESVVLHVDDRGRITIPKRVRERLGIEPNSELPARLEGSSLTVDPEPSARIEHATANRPDWTGTTPTDAGEALFGPIEEAPEPPADHQSSSAADDHSGRSGDEPRER